MTQLASDAWIPKAKKRKAYRDHYRDKFFGANNVVKGTSATKLSGSPKQQRLRVVQLMQATRQGNLPPEHSEMMTKLALEMRKTGFGLGPMGLVGETIQDLDMFEYAELKGFFF